ncbi:MAG: hypothetical protein JRH20_26520, partial [Deltaproteobacteria bacterium]|nr:hypothetical protein [Deltaproteobacteria bacterium]
DQEGMHLRYGDPALLDDPRFEPSRAHHGTTNWLHVPPVDLDWAVIEGMIKKSHTIAQQRGGGHLAAKKLYRPLSKGYETALEADRPQSLHAGGPAAKILAQEGPASFRLAIWATRQVAHLLPKGQRPALAGELKRLDEASEGYDTIVREVRMGKRYKAMDAISNRLWKNIVKGESTPIRCAIAANRVFHCIPGGYSQRAVGHAVTAIECAVKALNEAGGGEAVTEFLLELDDRVLAEEFSAACPAKAKQPAPAFERVLWRGADDKGYPALWLVRLAGERHAFLGKLGRRWRLSEGSIDDMLALVPDEHFEAAVMMVYERGAEQ